MPTPSRSDSPSSRPWADGPSDSDLLRDRLRARIAAAGPITFAEFMEAALYDQDRGFYARSHAVGERGEFVTSPHVSALFGVLVARQVEQFWQLLGRPDPFTLIEVGAGDGTLAAQIREALPQQLRSSIRYVAVERSSEARARLVERGFAVAAGLNELPPRPRRGCVLANELLDNLPFHWVRGTPEGLREVYVATSGDRFVAVEGQPSSSLVVRLAPDLGPGRDAAVSPAAHAFLEAAAARLLIGYLWLADYGFGPGEPPTGVHGYRRHRLVEDVLADPGTQDITAGVDFGSLAQHAREIGLRVWGPRRQRDVLLRLGFRELDRLAQVRQAQAIAARRGLDALRIYSNRGRANLLLADGGLGDFLVLCLGVGTDARPGTFDD